jgi:hypothetical protein
MHRWIAKFVVLVMLVPMFGPLALARLAPIEGMHCMRRPLGATVATPGDEPAMHCHEGVPQGAERNSGQSFEESSQAAATPDSSQASFRSPDCCRNHDCCRSAATSGRAHLIGIRSLHVSLRIEVALSALAATRVSSSLIGADSARAPPRS